MKNLKIQVVNLLAKFDFEYLNMKVDNFHIVKTNFLSKKDRELFLKYFQKDSRKAIYDFDGNRNFEIKKLKLKSVAKREFKFEKIFYVGRLRWIKVEFIFFPTPDIEYQIS